MKIVTGKWETFNLLEIHGRVDGLTAPEIKRAFDKITAFGQSRVIVDFSGVSFMSSAGLRVILQTHKSLKTIGGELILLAVQDTVAEVFRISGLEKIMTFFADKTLLHDYLAPEPARKTAEVFEVDGVKFSFQKFDSQEGNLCPMGSSLKLSSSGYSSGDVVQVRQADVSFAAGLAVLGDRYEDYKNVFGESIVVNHHFFSFPAVRRPYIDDAIYLPGLPRTLNFFSGFGMNGDFAGLLRVEDPNHTVTLDELVHAANKVAGSSCYGVVIVAQSDGLMEMNLKRVPITENRPDNGDIFDPEIFSRWMNFSPEEEDMNKTLVAVGIVDKSNNNLSPEKRNLFPDQSSLHFHALILENGLLCTSGEHLMDEIDRVIHEFAAEKVVHLLPASKIKSVFMGIINFGKR